MLAADGRTGGLKAFLTDHVDNSGHLPSAGVMPLLQYLRDEGVIAPGRTARHAPLDRFLDEYREWLAIKRALSPDTVRGYTRRAHRFLAERVSAEDELVAGAAHVEALAAAGRRPRFGRPTFSATSTPVIAR